MAHESQSLEVEILESPAPAESEAGVAPLASRAGGPRTPKGKTRSKHNALKHGLFSKVVLLKGEPQSDFDSVLNGLRNDLRPEGMLESILVEKLASLIWRQRRLLMAEGAEIRKGTEFFQIIDLSDDYETTPERAAEKKKLSAIARNVPDSPQLDRLLRYEASLERAFDRTLSQLEHLQRMRLGQPVLPKLEVQHSLS